MPSKFRVLKRRIIEEVSKIPFETICQSIAKWPERLQLCIDNESGHFECTMAHSNSILAHFTKIKEILFDYLFTSY